LHHVLNLEGLFGQIKSHLKEHGLFIISDIIGRNGHLRWPILPCLYASGSGTAFHKTNPYC
jgi:hypothetical protein